MRKLAIALVAVIVGAALPAAAQVGLYATTGGISVAVGPGYYVYGQLPLAHHRHFHHWHHARW
jgi:hypothetical protein